MSYTLEGLQQARDDMAATAEDNVTRLEQATEAMARGRVGQQGLFLMGELVDLAVALRDAVSYTHLTLPTTPYV